MPSIRLSEKDRERLGCPELLPFDIFSVTNREAIVLRDLGYTTPKQWRIALEAIPVEKDDDGKVIDAEIDYVAWTGLVWLSLRRAGIDTDVKTLEFDAYDIGYIKDPEPEPVKQGKERSR